VEGAGELVPPLVAGLLGDFPDEERSVQEQVLGGLDAGAQGGL
jgi:hypothetical protein